MSLSFFAGWLSMMLTLVIGHFLWQGLLIATLALLLTSCLRRSSARFRYGAFLTALLLMAGCPLLTFFWVDVPAQAETGAQVETMPWSARLHESLPDRHGASLGQSTPDDLVQKTMLPESPALPSIAPGLVDSKFVQRDLRRFAPIVSALYIAGVALLLGRLLLGLQGGRRLCRRSQPLDDPELLEILARQSKRLGVRFTALAAFCRYVAVPTVVGVLRPTILLPLSFASGLEPKLVEAILTHELAHLRRFDHLVNLLQRGIEAVLFFHPAVWLISQRIRIERENCCDDIVVELGAKPLDYAACLIRVAELSRLDSIPELAGLSIAGQRSRLGQRIMRLIGGPEEPAIRLTRGWGVTLGIVVMMAIAMPLVLRVQSMSSGMDNPNETTGQEDKPGKKDDEKQGPYSVHGRILDKDGRAMEGVEVDAHCGWGTLLPTGKVRSDREGRYSLHFGPGGRMKGGTGLQAATISAHKAGYFEKNLSRDGNLGMADAPLAPTDIHYFRDIVLPNQPMQVDFVMLPAAKVAGTLVGEDGKPVVGYKISLTGQVLPPSSSVIVSGDTDAQGRFQLRDIPTGYRFQFLIEPAKKESPWLAWATRPLEFRNPGNDDICTVQRENGRVTLESVVKRFEIQILGAGVSWREALKQAAGPDNPHYRVEDIHEQPDDIRMHTTEGVHRLILGSRIKAQEKNSSTLLDKRVSYEGKPISQWIEHLNNTDPAIRRQAAQSLGELGPDAKEAIPELIKRLRDTGAQVAVTARRALTKIGPAAVPALIDALRDTDKEVRWWAVQALGEMGPEAKSAIPALISALHDQSEAVRDSGAPGALAGIGSAAIPALLEALKDRDAFARAGAARALGLIGPKAKEAVPALLGALNDRRQPVKYSDCGDYLPVACSAATALGNIATDAKTVVPALVGLLGDENCVLRQTAVEALLEFGSGAREAVGALTALLNDKQEEIPVRVAMALGAIGPEAAPAVPALLDYLGRLDGDVNGARRDHVVKALASIGKPAAPALIEALRGGNENLRSRVAPALAGIADESAEAVPALVATLDDGPTSVRLAALEALARVGSRGRPAVSAINKALKDRNEEVRVHAARALFGIGPVAQDAVPALADALKDRDSDVRKEAAWALFAIGQRAKVALPALREAIQDGDKDVRAVVLKALKRIESAPSSAEARDPWRERFESGIR